MIKAQQGSLLQNQNQQLLGIRQAELDYFNNFYNNFGTQGKLVNHLIRVLPPFV
jgi:hypothetical protein